MVQQIPGPVKHSEGETRGQGDKETGRGIGGKGGKGEGRRSKVAGKQRGERAAMGERLAMK